MAANAARSGWYHWHHGADPEAVDVSFAVHLPVLDRLFGTHQLPRGRWPSAYGLAGGRGLPSGWLAQLVAPFRARETPTGRVDGF